MIIPIRCFTCGKVTGNKWEPYLHLLSQGVEEGDAMTRLGLKRWCCRRIILCHVDLSSRILNFNSFEDPHPPKIIRKKRERLSKIKKEPVIDSKRKRDPGAAVENIKHKKS
jgi:DNA-directed RNA polymerase I, II, and III subunit RPABC5